LVSSNTIFTNGLFDPWHLLSITSPIGEVQSVVYEAGNVLFPIECEWEYIFRCRTLCPHDESDEPRSPLFNTSKKNGGEFLKEST
jgi:hypothetical protein